ncbi:Pyridoxamine 5'-phosphate oxidase [Glycomyces sambucus]|uniref:Pyridoxamine 5'-phosphate oxidase n=1 Tax=Glycomyces sambucus TaxID=380244 RepID=A0A1G9FW45_9ACTN|nr:pyridoxal 5'-phosphate synthase [Glycomyces sambucus]SDK92666.1 Pyridoxamine 5'-phosphate oxidase [Glycomyces sambucus]
MGSMREEFRALPVFAGLRQAVFEESGLPENPVPRIGEWILAAADAGQAEAHAMSISTVSAEGVPSSRVLLVKDLDEHRLFFATPSDSRKGFEIAANPNVALHFYWPAVGRQIRIVGTAADQGREASERDFAERGRDSRLSAHLHRPEALAGHASAVDEFARLKDRYPDEVPCPPTWTLYAVTPTEVEFWEASADRVHHRLAYRKDATGFWSHELLWP